MNDDYSTLSLNGPYLSAKYLRFTWQALAEPALTDKFNFRICLENLDKPLPTVLTVGKGFAFLNE